MEYSIVDFIQFIKQQNLDPELFTQYSTEQKKLRKSFTAADIFEMYSGQSLVVPDKNGKDYVKPHLSSDFLLIAWKESGFLFGTNNLINNLAKENPVFAMGGKYPAFQGGFTFQDFIQRCEVIENTHLDHAELILMQSR